MRGWWINPDTGMMRQNRHYACIPINKGLPMGSKQYSIDVNLPDRNSSVFGSSLFTIDVELPVARTSIFGSKTYSISGGE